MWLRPSCGLAVRPLRAGEGGRVGGCGQGSSGQALLGYLCLAGTAPTTRWCPCCRAAVRCPHWWWRRGSSHSPAVRPPLPLGFVAHRDCAPSFPPFSQNPQHPSPGGTVGPSGSTSGTPPGSPSIPIPSTCASQSMALCSHIPAQEGPWPQLPGKLHLAWDMESPMPLLPVTLQTLILWIPPTHHRHSPPCSGWQISCHPASECRGGLSASSWSTCSRLQSATGSAGPLRASSNTGGQAEVVGGPALGEPQILPRLTIRVSLPELPHPLSPGGGSKKAAAGMRGPKVGTVGLPQNKP